MTPDAVAPEKRTARESALLEAACRLARARKRPAVFYILPDESIGTRNVREVGDAIGNREFEELDLVIHSIGGDIHAAYQLISYLRFRTKKLIACVPRYARSAATLLCVGADVIVLHELSALGPLDAQIFEGTTDGGTPRYNSALHAFKSLERLRDFSLETFGAAAGRLQAAGIFNRTDDTVRYAMEFVRVTAAPLFDKIPSERLGDYSQALAIGEEYGGRLLGRKTPPLPEEKQKKILRRLVHEYPSHEYVIDIRELRNLGLAAELFGSDEKDAAWGFAELCDKSRLIALIDPDTPPSVAAEMRSKQAENGDAGVATDRDGADMVPDALVVRSQSSEDTDRGRETKSPNPWDKF